MVCWGRSITGFLFKPTTTLRCFALGQAEVNWFSLVHATASKAVVSLGVNKPNIKLSCLRSISESQTPSPATRSELKIHPVDLAQGRKPVSTEEGVSRWWQRYAWVEVGLGAAPGTILIPL